MLDNIHRWLVVRLALTWLVLSLVIGGMVQYFGNRRMNNHVVKAAAPFFCWSHLWFRWARKKC